MEFWHMNGAGNDFVVMDARGLSPDYSTLAKSFCRQTGADGFMAVDTSTYGDFRLHFYNSDGTRGEMCGNGSRCICRFAYEKGIAGRHMTVETDAGMVEGWRLDRDTYRVKLNNPGVLDLNRREDAAYVELGCPGVPHAVVACPELTYPAKEKLRAKAVELRHDPAFPKGANVNFYRMTGEKTARILTFERGVEDYTLACGTGCGSVAVTLWKQGRLPGGMLVAENPGGTLTVQVEAERESLKAIYLSGPTEITEIWQEEL